MFQLRRYIKHSRQCFISYPNISNFVKNTPQHIVFSAVFSVFGYPNDSLSHLWYIQDHQYLDLLIGSSNLLQLFIDVFWSLLRTGPFLKHTSFSQKGLSLGKPRVIYTNIIVYQICFLLLSFKRYRKLQGTPAIYAIKTK